MIHLAARTHLRDLEQTLEATDDSWVPGARYNEAKKFPLHRAISEVYGDELDEKEQKQLHNQLQRNIKADLKERLIALYEGDEDEAGEGESEVESEDESDEERKAEAQERKE